MIKYLGSKKKLLDDIYKATLDGFDGEIETVIDLFSGTSRVGHHFKSKGHKVISNDLSEYGKVLAEALVVADKQSFEEEAKKWIKHYNDDKGTLDGYFTETFCRQSRFFQEKNGKRVDYIREDIETRDFDPILKSILLTSLMLAADKVDSTCGVQMAYLKKWAKRSENDLELKMPLLTNESKYGPSEAHQGDALEKSKTLKADVAYLDPPYNQHSYLGNYHVWESLCKWDKPEVYGVACKRVDVKTRKSDFNKKREAINAMRKVIDNCALNVKRIVVSFNDEGYITKQEMLDLLNKHGQTKVTTIQYDRYIGSQIGIHNKKGEKVGVKGEKKNNEFIFVTDID
jgi:adenine-specific DNA-methyltransferase